MCQLHYRGGKTGACKPEKHRGRKHQKRGNPDRSDYERPADIVRGEECPLNIGRKQVEKAVGNPADSKLCDRDREYDRKRSVAVEESDKGREEAVVNVNDRYSV